MHIFHRFPSIAHFENCDSANVDIEGKARTRRGRQKAPGFCPTVAACSCR